MYFAPSSVDIHIISCPPTHVACSERLLVEYENALVLVTDMKIENVKDIIPLLEQVVEACVELYSGPAEFERKHFARDAFQPPHLSASVTTIIHSLLRLAFRRRSPA